MPTGHARLIPIIQGQKFGKLTTIEFAYQKYGQRYARYICDCGSICEFKTYDTKKGNKTQCRKCGYKQAGINKKLLPGLAAKRSIINQYKANAKIRNLDFTLSDKEISNMLEQNCFYCGTSPSNFKLSSTKIIQEGFKYNGIDRINNTLGYTKCNAVTCCIICNKAKADMSQSKFLSWISLVYKYSINEGKK